MTINTPNYIFKTVPLKSIDLDDRLTCFSFGVPSDSLQKSIEEVGIIHPITLIPIGERFRIVCGHHRAKVSSSLLVKEIPARILDSAINDESLLVMNLSENQCHRHYSDIEKGLILSKLSEVDVSANRIIEKYMPLVNLEQSKKLLDDYLSICQLTIEIKMLLHEMNIPLRIFSVFFDWDIESIIAAEKFFSVLRPGANKWRDLLEWIDEISKRDEITPCKVFKLPELQSALNHNDLAPNLRYERIRQILYSSRYPILNDMRIRLARALDSLKLDDKTKVHVQDSFESDEIRIEMKFRTRDEFVNQLEKLVRASDSEALDELIRIFKNP